MRRYVEILKVAMVAASILSSCTFGGLKTSVVKRSKPTPAISKPTKILGVSPDVIFTGGGTVVKVSVENFDPVFTVKFNNAPASDLKIISATEIQVSTPSTAEGDVKLTILNESQELASSQLKSSRDAFTRILNFTGTDNLQATTDGVQSVARAYQPLGVAYGNGKIYFSQYDNVIRVFDLETSKTKTIAGQSGPNAFADGISSIARFATPHSLVLDGDSLYVADNANHAIREINLKTYDVTTLAGGTGAGSTDGSLASAKLDRPSGLALVGTSLYVSSHDNTIRHINLVSKTISTIAGSPNLSGAVDSTGVAARFNSPYGLTFAGGFLYVADLNNRTVRKVDVSNGAVTTFAGQSGVVGDADGIGTAATFNGPLGVSSDGTYLWITDHLICKIRRITISDQNVYSAAGSQQTRGNQIEGIGANAGLHYPYFNAVAGGNLFFADMENGALRKMNTSTFEVDTLVGKKNGYQTANGSAAVTAIRDGRGIVHDDNYFYIAEHVGQVVRKINRKTGESSVLAGKISEQGQVNGSASDARFLFPWGLAIKGTDLFMSDFYGAKIRKISTIDGTTSTLVDTVTYPANMAVHNNTLYVCQFLKHTIHKVDLSTGAYSIYAGALDTSGYADGPVLDARFATPIGCHVIGDRLFVSESGNKTIRAIDLTTNIVSTIAGIPAYNGDPTIKDGPADQAKFFNPAYLVSDGLNLYVSEHHGLAVRKISLSSPTRDVSTIAGRFFSPGNSPILTESSLAKVWGLDLVPSEGLFLGSSTATFWLK